MTEPDHPPRPPEPATGWQPWRPPPPPGSGWTGPAPQPTWAEPPQWGSTQPQGAAPPQGYWQAPPAQGNSVLAVIAGAVLLVMGILVGLIGLAFVILVAAGPELLAELDPSLGIPGAAIGAVLTVIAVVLLIFAALNVLAAIGVFLHKGWARWTGIVTGAIGLILGLLSLIGQAGAGGAADVLFVLLWLAAYGFVLVALSVGGEHFERRYPSR